MAKIVLGIGTSHSPLLVLGGGQWELRSHDDRRSKSLNTIDGRLVSYEELVLERGEAYATEANPENFPNLAARAEAALDTLAAALRSARPDVVLVVGDDQGELFGPENFPAISVYRGDELVMKPSEHLTGMPPWADRQFWSGYRMDLPHRYPGAPGLGLELVNGLIQRGVDVASSDRVLDPTVRGFGHAFGFVIQRLMKGLDVPMLPVLLNTYFPPNTPTAARCHEVGTKIAGALAESKSTARVAVVASGGLSHFVCEEALDRSLMDAFRNHDRETLSRVPQQALLSGSSEIRNWITVAGMVSQLTMEFSDYIPVRRTPAGTGIGLAFVTWK
ncbi:MAG: Extradiol ring-cleavage dioxygenase class protein subunit [Ramlibacter sp.]|nr:Extradiol ring-cleavage dioxygenase class protein subunit [Ramlibacter sp.]